MYFFQWLLFSILFLRMWQIEYTLGCFEIYLSLLMHI